MSLGISASSRYQLEIVDKEGIIIYRQGREDLILRVQYRLKARDGSQKEVKAEAKPVTVDVAALAWIVPVPSLPRSYGEVDAKAFQSLYDLLRIPVSNNGGSFSGGGFGGASGRADPSVVIYPAATAGEYAIQPVRGVGPEAARGLKEWFKTNEFEPLPEESLAFYARNGWTFLAIRHNNKGAKCCVSGTLPALRVSFRSDRPRFPLKLARSAGMSARIYVLLNYKIPNAPQALQPFNFQLQGARILTRANLDETLTGVWNDSALAGTSAAYLYEYRASSLQPENWPVDVALPGPPLFPDN